MKTYRTETLILGAGPAGLACAMELSKEKKDFIVIEKDSVPGGLSKTYRFEESDGSVFLTDNGPHRFFSKNPYLYRFIGDVLGADWIKVRRQTRQYIDGKFYDYPIKAIQAFRNIGLKDSMLMCADYISAKIRYGVCKKPIRNFREYIEAHFGKRLGEFSMINYTEKIWGIPAESIHQDWAKQRIKGLDLRKVIFAAIKNAFQLKGGSGSASLINEFYYPSKGSGEVYERIVEILQKKGYLIRFGCSTTRIDVVPDGFVMETIIDGEPCAIHSKYLVESVPVTHFARLIHPQPPQKTLDALSKLSYRDQAYLFITLDKNQLTEDQWIYLPTKEIPFGRISEMKNFSEKMSPVGKTSLFIEFFCTKHDAIWEMGAHDLFEIAFPHIEKMGLFSRTEVRHMYVMRQENVYPVYDLSYKKRISEITSYLDAVPRLFAIGRPGRFRYNNQDHSLEMGMLAAKSIIDQTRYDLDSIGDEDDYYEKGSHHANEITDDAPDRHNIDTKSSSK